MSSNASAEMKDAEIGEESIVKLTIDSYIGIAFGHRPELTGPSCGCTETDTQWLPESLRMHFRDSHPDHSNELDLQLRLLEEPLALSQDYCIQIGDHIINPHPIACRVAGCGGGAIEVSGIQDHLNTAHASLMDQWESKEQVSCPWIQEGIACTAKVQKRSLSRHITYSHAVHAVCPYCFAGIGRPDALQRHLKSCKVWKGGIDGTPEERSD